MNKELVILFIDKYIFLDLRIFLFLLKSAYIFSDNMNYLRFKIFS